MQTILKGFIIKCNNCGKEIIITTKEEMNNADIGIYGYSPCDGWVRAGIQCHICLNGIEFDS